MKVLEAFDLDTGEDDMNQPQMFNNYMDNSLLSEDEFSPDPRLKHTESDEKRLTFGK